MTRSPGDPLGDPVPGSLPTASFARVRWREGYAIAEVDAFIERAVAALASPSPAMRPADVRAARFRPVRVREGYEMAEVDAYLDALEAQLATRHPEPDPEQPVAADRWLLGALKPGTWAGKLTWVLLLLVLLVWLFAELVRPHWAGG